jgi:hypothetical protein
MRIKLLLVFLLLATSPVRAQVNPCIIAFPSLSACEGANCRVLIDLDPGGEARILSDNRYGRQLAVNFGPESVFDLGDNGRINFGISGGFEGIFSTGTAFPVCTFFGSGSRAYSVDLATGGRLLFTGNNRMDFKVDNHFVLGGGSKIDGRLVINGAGTVSILSADADLTMPNLDISAAEGINVMVGQGDVQLGGLLSEGTDPSGNSGILITSGGDVEIDNVDSASDFTVIAEGDITIGAIGNAESISLTINPPATGAIGVITINGQVTTDNPVICGPPDDCSDFQVDDGGGGSGSTDCNTVSSDPNVDRPDNCAGGGAIGPGFVLLCMLVLYRKHRTTGRTS